MGIQAWLGARACPTLMRTPVVKRQTPPKGGFLCFFPQSWSWRRSSLATCAVLVSLSRYGHRVSAPHTY
jgi:hypothetical protein